LYETRKQSRQKTYRFRKRSCWKTRIKFEYKILRITHWFKQLLNNSLPTHKVDVDRVKTTKRSLNCYWEYTGIKRWLWSGSKFKKNLVLILLFKRLPQRSKLIANLLEKSLNIGIVLRSKYSLLSIYKKIIVLLIIYVN
jgi:hypothetical protein